MDRIGEFEMRGALLRIGIGVGAVAIAAAAFALPRVLHWHGSSTGVVPAASAAKTAPAGILHFTDHTGRGVSESDFAGRFQLVFFGYTYCPEVCPTNLQVMTQAMQALGERGERVQPIFISFDPERDTPEVLARYVGRFHPRLVGLTGTPQQIAAAARSYDVYVERVDAQGNGSSDYAMSHTAKTYLIGPDGSGVAIFDHATDPEEMAAEILEHLKDHPSAGR